jgi:hypothetical protein
MNPNQPAGNGQPTPQPPQSGAQPNAQPGQPQPVAYDNQGRPLYLHPPAPGTNQPQMVYIARPLDPEKIPISEAAKQRHAESKKKWPELNLSDGEYVVSAVKRHPIGLLRIWAVVVLMMLVFAASAVLFFRGGVITDSEGMSTVLAAGVAFLCVLVVLGGMAATYVYNNNRFFLTNESVIQEIQTSLFSKHEQTVLLSNIEDASYKQKHVIQTIFNYGTIRLSTEGDETTYTFDYVANPKKHIARLNNAVEDFKNGRPVDMEESELATA